MSSNFSRDCLNRPANNRTGDSPTINYTCGDTNKEQIRNTNKLTQASDHRNEIKLDESRLSLSLTTDTLEEPTSSRSSQSPSLSNMSPTTITTITSVTNNYITNNDEDTNDVNKNDVHKNDVHKNDVNKNDVNKNDVHKNDVHKNDVHKNDVHKNDVHKNDGNTNDGNTNDMEMVEEGTDTKFSYIKAIADTIIETPHKAILLSDLYTKILVNYPVVSKKKIDWRNGIRHNLSLNKCFVKLGRNPNGKGHYWGIRPFNLEYFLKRDYRRRWTQSRSRQRRSKYANGYERDYVENVVIEDDVFESADQSMQEYLRRNNSPNNVSCFSTALKRNLYDKYYIRPRSLDAFPPPTSLHTSTYALPPPYLFSNFDESAPYHMPQIYASYYSNPHIPHISHIPHIPHILHAAHDGGVNSFGGVGDINSFNGVNSQPERPTTQPFISMEELTRNVGRVSEVSLRSASDRVPLSKLTENSSLYEPIIRPKLPSGPIFGDSYGTPPNNRMRRQPGSTSSNFDVNSLLNRR